MLIKTRAIVLSKLKYRDHDLIVKCYTEHRGVVSYIVRGVLKSTKNNKIAYFQPLSQLQIEENFRANQSLQSIKELKLDCVYSTMHTNVFKSSIAMFLAEVLSIVLKEEEENKSLYNYIETALQWLDYEDDFSNFHLLFLLNLTKHLGFYPDSANQSQPFFNLRNGLFEAKKQDYYSISDENLTILKRFLGMKFDELNSIKLNSNQRQSFLNTIFIYYEMHLGNFRKPKSLQVFNQVFS